MRRTPLQRARFRVPPMAPKGALGVAPTAVKQGIAAAAPDKPAAFVFALCAVGDGPEERIRVKRLLKRLGRQHGLRVKWPEPPADAPAAQPTPAAAIVEGTR